MANDKEIGKLVIRLVAEVKDLKKQLADVQGDMRAFSVQTTKHTESFADSIGGIKKAYLSAVAAIYAAYKTLQTALRWQELGAQSESVEQSFALMTKSIGVNGDLLIGKLKETGYVFVESTDMMIKAMRLLDVGVSGGEIIKLMESARVAARFMGVGVGEAFDKISEALITLQTRGIKRAFPTDVEELVRKYADSLGVAKDLINDTGKRQAILNAIFEGTQIRLKQLGGELHPTSSEKLEKLRSAFAQLAEDIGKELLPALASIGPTVLDMVKALSDMVVQLKAFSDEFGLIFFAINTGLRTVLSGVLGLFTGVTVIFLALMEINKELLEMINFVTLGLIPGMDKMLESFRARQQKVIDSLVEQTQVLHELLFGKKAEVEKKPVSPVIPEKEKVKKDLKDLGVIMEEFNKRQSEIILSLKARTAEAEKSLVEAAAEKMRAEAISSAVRRGEDTFEIEHEYAVKKANDTYRIALDSLNAQMAEEENQIKTKMGSVTPAIRAELDKKYNTLRIVEASKNAAEIANVDLQYFVQSKERQLAIGEAANRVEISSKQAVLAAAEDLYERQLISARTFYETKNDMVIATGTDEIRMLQERLNLEIDETKKADLRAQIIEKTNTLEKELTALKWDGYQATLKESDAWVSIFKSYVDRQNIVIDMQRRNFEITEVEALEKRIALERDLLSKLQEQLSAIDQISDPQRYADQLASIQQVKAGIQDMTLSLKEQTGTFMELTELGVKKYAESLKASLIDTFENALPNAIGAGTDALGSFFENLTSGTMSTGDAVRQLANDFSKSVMRMIIDVGMLILKMQILRLLQSAAGAGGGAAGAGAAAMQHGGPVVGPSGRDRVPIDATAGEYVHPVPAVRYYGLEAMEALRRRKIPREVFTGLNVPVAHRSLRAFAEGGEVSSGSASKGGTEKGRGEKIEINLINIVDRSEMDRWAAGSSFENSVLNIMSSRGQTIKKILR